MVLNFRDVWLLAAGVRCQCSGVSIDSAETPPDRMLNTEP